MRVLILGGQGMLGHKLFQTLTALGTPYDTYTTFRHANGPWTNFPLFRDRTRAIPGVDARRFDDLIDAFAGLQPDVVVNCIGIIKQLDSANDPILSLEVNALFPHRLARLCLATGTRLIHISTDCVFSGLKGSYTEDDRPDPVDLYGHTKLLGEVDRSGCLTLRTSIIGRDFVKRVGLLEWFLSNRGGRVNGFTRAIYSGLTTQALAGIIQQLILDHPNMHGLYQVASAPITKYELLVKIRDAMQLDIEIAPSSEFFCDRTLIGSRFEEATDLVTPSWDEMIADLASDPTPYDDWSNSK